MAINNAIPIPTPYSQWFTPDGRPTPDAYQWLLQVDTVVRLVVGDVNTPAPVDSVILTEVYTYVVATPSNKAYPPFLKLPFGYTVDAVTTKCVSGTCTLSPTLDGVALGGGTNAVSSSEVSVARTDVAVADQDLGFTISANASCVDLSVTFVIHRTVTG